MEDKIKSISEAYSAQPLTLIVDKEPRPFDPENSIKEIKEIRLEDLAYENVCVYVGYNFEGKKIFQYHMMSVNVHYI
jgi:hypothetical protein